ncbi:MAG: hypothetical protein ACXWW0_13170 [Bacteroidia bacterium]
MKYLVFLVINAVILNACSNQKELNQNKFESLLSKYKDITFDTLHIYSSQPVEKDSFKYKGNKLDSLDVVLLTGETQKDHFFYEEFFSCYKFNIDSIRIGLISRVPGQNSSSAIQIYIYDKAKDSITENAELADNWGDAGFHFEEESYLFWDNNSGLKLFSWIYESEDHSIENENDTTIEERRHYHLVDYSKNLHDTISRNAKYLSREFTGEKLTGNFWIDRYNVFLNPTKDSIGVKTAIFYLNHPKVNQIAKDFYYGKFKPTDNDSTTKLLALVITCNEELRPFYRWCLDRTIFISDGALGEYPGEPALQYALKYPQQFFLYMDLDKTGKRYKMWSEIIAYSGLNGYDNVPLTQIEQNLITEMTQNCNDSNQNLQERIKRFANDLISYIEDLE